MNITFLIRFFSFSLVFLLNFYPASLSAGEIDSSLQSSTPVTIDESLGEMTQKQLNDLFGEDPYLGQTSYLQSPDSYGKREK